MVETVLKKSLADLQLSYIDLYLVQVPFGIIRNEKGAVLRDENGIVPASDTDHVAVWKVSPKYSHFSCIRVCFLSKEYGSCCGEGSCKVNRAVQLQYQANSKSSGQCQNSTSKSSGIVIESTSKHHATCARVFLSRLSTTFTCNKRI